MSDSKEEEHRKACELFRIAQLKLAKTISRKLRMYGIEMTPDEALSLYREEQVNAIRQIFREDAVKWMREAMENQ